MTRVVNRQDNMTEVTLPRVQKNLADLNNDVLLLIFGLLDHGEHRRVAALSRRLRAVLLQLIFRRVRWAPGLRGFPPEILWPHIQFFTLVGVDISDLDDGIRADIVSHLRDGLPHMKHLQEFTVDDSVAGGLWSELLDAITIAPCCLVIDALWEPQDRTKRITLAPRTSPLPFPGISYTIPFMQDALNGGVMRRSPYTFALEENNLRVILEASAQVLEAVSLPGELFPRVMRPYVAWHALRAVYLTGFWPLVEAGDLVTAPHDAMVVAPASAGTAEVVIPLTSGEAPAPDKAESPAIHDDITVTASKGSLTSADLAPDVDEPSIVHDNDNSTPTVSSKDKILVAPASPKSADGASSPKSPEVDLTSSTTVEVSSLESAGDTLSEAPAAPTSSHRSPILSLLEAMPNLRLLHLRLNRYVMDTLHPPITTPESPPRFPHSFLRHLIEFEATSLSNDDRTLGFLPSQLEILSLRRHPILLRTNMRPTIPTPGAVLAMLEQARFSELKYLRLWYMIESLEDIESDKRLLSRLPEMFPLLEHLELCRLWEHEAPSLEGLWDPVPLVRTLVSQLKHLRILRFDPATPERHGTNPFARPSKELRQYLVQLHGIAEEIISDAPWLKRIALYLEYGSKEDLFWEDWGVVVVPGKKVALDRRPPKVIDSLF
ncbi:hypothetical protein C8F01DRAFT_1119384 [Mycena amicta]|nr:hypothetical protein C8F01DRAFT_1119384 [Mycena amicta]